MIKKAHKYLTALGLKDNEADVYLSCFQKPMGLFVHEIVNATNLKRSTIDLILNRLRKQGFVSRHKQGARWVYCAEAPEKISYSIHDTISEFDDFIPSLVSSIGDGHIPTVRFYEGPKGIESVYEDILLSCKRLVSSDQNLLIISSGKDLISLLPEHYSDFVKKRVRSGIRAKMLCPDNIVSRRIYKVSKPNLRETKFFDEGTFPFKTEINIYGNKIALINFSDPGIMATVIDSAAISSSMASIFNMLWIFCNNTKSG